MNTQDTPASKIAAEYIKSQVEKNLPGVTLKIKQMPFKQKTTLELANNYEASYSGWSPDYPDPTAFLQTMTKDNAQNNTDWSNKEYDQLLKEANSKLLRKPGERNTSLQKRNISYYMKRQSLLFIKRRGTLNESASKRITISQSRA